MLIMPANAKNFQQMASAIVKDFFTRGNSLEDGIVKAAEQFEMTPEEVKRLVEKTNTAASIQFLRCADNKKDSFDLAKFSSVLSRTHSTSESVTEEPKSEYAGLPHTRDERLPEKEKTASAADSGTEKGGMSDASRLFAMRQYVDALKQEKMAEELAVRDDIDFLLSEFSSMHGPDFLKFASEASALYGPVADMLIPGMAGYLNVDSRFEKLAEGTVIDDTTDVMRHMGNICTGLGKLAEMEQRLQEASSAVKWYAEKLYRR